MPSVSETELEQKISEFISFVKDFTANRRGDFVLRGKNDNFKIASFADEIVLEFIV